jgi:aminoglycoside/choline kinase family phosphotransferase
MSQEVELSIGSLYESWKGEKPISIARLAAAASKRQYFRIRGKDGNFIATYHTDPKENNTFVAFAKHFHSQGLPVPNVLKTYLGQGGYFQEDLGDISLYSLLPKPGAPFSEALLGQFRKVVTELPKMQVLGGKGLDYSYCYPKGNFDAKAMHWDMQYFKYYYLKLLDFPYDEQELEANFGWLAKWLATAGADHFMLRDCQSRNILIKNGQPYFIDFQGGRKGPLQYDLVSLIWQAKANIPNAYRAELVEAYLDSLSKFQQVDRKQFLEYYYGFVLIRTLQVLGAYGLRGLVQRKAHFIQSIPMALKNAAWLLEQGHIPKELNALRYAVEQIIKHPPAEVAPKPNGKDKPLVVTVQSFSFKRGIPNDDSGHGGGFIFDCRSLHNPGRYTPYKKLTGRDQSVKEFLLEKSKMSAFLESVYELVDSAVENYLERNFDSLTVNFGCTGGQHRSVFAADRLSEHLEEKYGVKVRLQHIEQERKNWIN